MSEESPSEKGLAHLPGYGWAKPRPKAAIPQSGSVNSAQRKFNLVVNTFRLARIAAVVVLAVLIILRL